MQSYQYFITIQIKCNSFAAPVCWFDILPMFTFAAETTKDMKKHLVLLSAVLLVQAVAISVFAQQKPKAGDLIQGVVTDSVSPLMAVYITELDSADRAVAYAYTDLKGEFSFSLVNTKDRIQFSYYRKEKIVLPIDKAYFEIRMEDDKDLPPIDWDEFVSLDSRDVRDAAKSPVLIDISEYESLGLYTIDEILNAKMGLDLPWFDDTDIIHGYVDLGLSVKWATCNVGAESPEDYGDYYAWGETETKDVYDWSSYKWCNGSSDTLTKYNPFKVQGIVDSITTLDPNDDVAHVKWGGSWRMPTASEFRELMDNCKWTWKSVNGINGYVVKSRIKGYTDRSIFLPVAGYCYDKELCCAGEVAYYWSNSLFDFPISAKSILLSSDDFCRHYCSRFVGNPVRPVHP